MLFKLAFELSNEKKSSYFYTARGVTEFYFCLSWVDSKSRQQAAELNAAKWCIIQM